MANKIKLFCSDVDGTLLPKNETVIPEENRRLILSLIGENVAFAAVSGRDVLSLKKLFSFCCDKITLVGCDGAVAISGGKTVYSRPVPDAAVIKALKFSELGKKPLVLCGSEKIYVSSYGGEKFFAYVKSLYGDDTVMVKTTPEIRENIYKISFFSETGVSGCDLSAFGVRKSYNRNGWEEYVSALANKGAAFSELQIRNACGRASSAAAGDDVSDIPMLSKAGIAFAFDPEIAKMVQGAKYVGDFSNISRYL